MINVTLGKKDGKPYPKLMKSAGTGNIVLFQSFQNGTVVHIGESNFGTYKIAESSTFGMEYFEDYNEPITIQNA